MPILAAIKLWSIWSKLDGWIGTFGAWGLKNPLVTFLVMLLAISGVGNLWQWHAGSQKSAWISSEKTAQKQVLVIAKTDTAGAFAAVVKLDGVTDHGYEDGLAQGKTELAAYIAAHSNDSLRPAAPSGDATPAASQNHPAAIAPKPAAAPAVAFSEAQLSDWDQDYQSALTCQTWAARIATLFDGKHWPTPEEIGTPDAPAAAPDSPNP